jgi:hypothetical protein
MSVLPYVLINMKMGYIEELLNYNGLRIFVIVEVQAAVIGFYFFNVFHPAVNVIYK